MRRVLFLCLSSFFTAQSGFAQQAVWPAKTRYLYQKVGDYKIFYREAGDPKKPTILLLHGYPSSSHEYRELIPLLSGRYHVVAPDYLGAGYSDHPSPDKTVYTFDLLAKVMEGFVKGKGLKRYVMYMQDFGAPVGFRVLLSNPANVKGLILQNANAYMDGLTPMRRAFFHDAFADRSTIGTAKVAAFVSRDSIIHRQYLRDVKGKEEIVSPDSWNDDLSHLTTEAGRRVEIQLFQDYYNNLLSYPKWQALLHRHPYPALIVWGKRDPAFIAPGATAYLRDLPDAKLHFVDAGHFAVEEKPVEIAKQIVRFMSSLKK